MSRWFFLMAGLVLVLAACGSAVDNPVNTTTSVITTTSPLETTTSETTGATGTSTTSSEATTTTTDAGPTVTLIEISVTLGTVERVERFDVPLDGAVRVVVLADVSDEIHLHGYDLHADVIPGREALFEFDATIAGVFEIELEGSGELIGELQVAP